jgi:hypothetical protein
MGNSGEESGPAGSYTYGVSAYSHAATSVGSGYTASYDASGNMTCRAPSSSVNCGTTPTGQVMSYDNAGRMTHWQDRPTSPSHQQDLAYDGRATASSSRAPRVFPGTRFEKTLIAIVSSILFVVVCTTGGQ